jgi:hypothetical protein
MFTIPKWVVYDIGFTHMILNGKFIKLNEGFSSAYV